MPDLTRHPLPWSDVRDRMHLAGTDPGWDEDGALVTLRMGSRRWDGMFSPKTRAELAALRDQLGEILRAPYRLYVAGGDCVDAAREWPQIYQWLDERHAEVTAAGWHLQVVTGPENAAQSLVYTWALKRKVEVIGTRPVEFGAGGTAVAMMPTVHGLDILEAARGRYGLPVYRMPPYGRWGGG